MADEAEDVFTLIGDRSKEAADSLIDNFADSIFNVGNNVKSLKETFSDFFNQLQADILKMTLKEGLSSILGGSGGNGSGGGLLSCLFGSSGMNAGSGSGLLGGLSSFFGGFFASGGTVKPGKAHVVGDGGEPELFVPHSVGSVIPFSQLQGLGAGSNNIVVNMNIQTPDISSFNQSRSRISADMARQIARSSRNL